MNFCDIRFPSSVLPGAPISSVAVAMGKIVAILAIEDSYTYSRFNILTENHVIPITIGHDCQGKYDKANVLEILDKIRSDLISNWHKVPCE